MKDLLNPLLSFLRSRLDPSRPLLLGLSGGPDSLALFYLLLEVQKKIPFTLGVAHVDHGWRQDSAKEAAKLKELASRSAAPFHLKTLEACFSESTSRQKRLTFFEELCQVHKYQAVILAHHKGDQAETVLKNLFEGASLPSCNGILETSSIGKLQIWRPLLQTPKKKLLAWLKKRGVEAFDDVTNRDPAYLRARMRTQLLPALEELFGKGIENTLASVGKEAHELSEFLLEHLAEPLKAIKDGEGMCVDISKYPKLTLFECKFLIRYACRLAFCFPSKQIVDNAAFQLLQRASKKQYAMGKIRITVDRGRMNICQG